MWKAASRLLRPPPNGCCRDLAAPLSHLPLRNLRLFEQSTLWADYLGNDMGFPHHPRTFRGGPQTGREELSRARTSHLWQVRPAHGHSTTTCSM